MTNPTTTQFNAASQYLQSVDKNISAGEVWVFAVLAFSGDAFFRTPVSNFTAAERQYLNYLVARGLAVVKRSARPQALHVLVASPSSDAIKALATEGHLTLIP